MSDTRTSLDTLLPVIVQRLSAPQAAFLGRYISVGLVTGKYDAVDAARVVYPRAKNHQVLALQILNRRGIRKILDQHFKRSELESVLLDVTRFLKRARRRGANTDVLVPQLAKLVKALEAIAAKNSMQATGN